MKTETLFLRFVEANGLQPSAKIAPIIGRSVRSVERARAAYLRGTDIPKKEPTETDIGPTKVPTEKGATQESHSGLNFVGTDIAGILDPDIGIFDASGEVAAQMTAPEPEPVDTGVAPVREPETVDPLPSTPPPGGPGAMNAPSSGGDQIPARPFAPRNGPGERSLLRRIIETNPDSIEGFIERSVRGRNLQPTDIRSLIKSVLAGWKV